MKRLFLFTVAGACFLLMLALACTVSMYSATRTYIYRSAAEAPQAHVALVLGAAVSPDGSLSPLFRDRIDSALDLYRKGRVSKILISGDNSTKTYNEVDPARLYLLDNGVPEEDLYTDHAGFDTYSTMYRARDIFEISSMVITTQNFHLPRSVFIARSLGIEAYGVRVDDRPVLLRNYVRETFASVKAVLDVVTNRTPKYLGETLPIPKD